MPAIISMFRSSPWSPVFLEDQKKWYGEKARALGVASHYHYNQTDFAILLLDGIPLSGVENMELLFFKELLSKKIKNIREYS